MITIRDLMTDPELFGKRFGGESWQAWRTLLAGFYGLPLHDDELDQWHALTRRKAPQSASSELWLVVGRRGGKSQAAALLAVLEAAFFFEQDKLAPGEVATVRVMAADKAQARTVFRYVSGLLRSNPMLEALIISQDKESIELSNRVCIEIGTASYRSARGYSYKAIIADEVAFWRDAESANPDVEILKAVRPGLATLGGPLIALSSPYARRGALWSTYRKHYGQEGRILVAQAPSRMMNPTLPLHVVQEAYQDDPAAAAAEYGAEFRTDVESYVSVEALEACTRQSHPEIMPSSGQHYSAFVDPSGGSVDAFTLAICHMDRESGVVIVDAIRSTKPPFSPESVVSEYCDLLKSYRCNTVTGDAYAGEWPREQFSKRGIQYRKSDRAKSELYRDLLPLINSGRVELPPDSQLLRELQGLERRTSRAGRDTIDHAPNSHDDLANAVAGAVVYAKKPPGVIYTGIGYAM